MAASSHLKNPPITEALLDIKAILPKDINADTLLETYEAEKQRYPIKEVKAEWEASFQIKPGESPILSQRGGTPQGYMLRSVDKIKVFQSRLDGFTYNQLSPYDTWESFINEGLRLWKVYSQIAKPISITRIALRFINKIEIPLPVSDLTEYINTLPSVLLSPDEKKLKYFMNVHLEDTKSKNECILTNVIEEQPNSNVVTIIIDVDAYKMTDMGMQEILPVITSLKDYKNKVFFNCISDKTKQIFQ